MKQSSNRVLADRSVRSILNQTNFIVVGTFKSNLFEIVILNQFSDLKQSSKWCFCNFDLKSFND